MSISLNLYRDDELINRVDIECPKDLHSALEMYGVLKQAILLLQHRGVK